MSITASFLFPRGTTPGMTSATAGLHYEGVEVECDDINYGASQPTLTKREGFSNRRIRLRACRNLTGATIYAKLLAVLARDTKANYAGGTGAPTATGGVQGSTRIRELARLGSSATVMSAKCYPIDEYLPSAGVAANDICWVVLRGPAICKTSLANMAADIAVGDALVAVTATTAAATDGTTGGRVTGIDLVVTSLPDGQVGRTIGLAMTALLTNTTNTDVLVDVGGHYN
jgi:hypothetical protein